MAHERILIVEDDGIISKDVAVILQDLDYQVVAIVSTGESAIHAAIELKPDLILMDIVLKGEMDGIVAAERIHSQADIPVVYLTAYGDGYHLQRASITGPFGYLLKPFDERTLHATLEMALYKHHLERRVKESEERYRLIATSVADMIWLMDMNLRTTFISPSVERERGFTLEELQALPLDKQLTPESLQVALQVMMQELTPDTSGRKDLLFARTLELEFYRKDDSTFWGEVTINVIRDDQGLPISFLGVGHNITERKLALEEMEVLIRVAAAMRTAPNRAEIASVVVNQLLSLFHVAGVVLTLLDAKSGEPCVLVGSGVWEKQAGICPSAENCLGRQVILGGMPYLNNNLVGSQPDCPRGIFMNLVAFAGIPLIANQKTIGMLGVGSYQVIKEQTLRLLIAIGEMVANALNRATLYESEQSQRQLAEALSQAAASLNQSLDLNHVLDAILEQAMRVASCQDSSILLIEGDQARVARQHGVGAPVGSLLPLALPTLKYMMETGQPIEITDTQTDARWSELPFTRHIRSYVGVPLFLGKEIIGFLNVDSDQPDFFGPDAGKHLLAFASHASIAIHNARLHADLQDQLEAHRKTQARLIQSEKLAALGELVAGVAHELNNPLTSILLHAQLMQDQPLNKEQESDLNTVIQEAERSSKIVRGLLEFSRQRSSERKWVQINHVLQGALDLMAHELRSHNVQVNTHFDPGLPVTIADPFQLQQAFVNIITNARQAMSEERRGKAQGKTRGGELRITTQMAPAALLNGQDETAPVIRITFQDNGSGIPQDLLTCIFDPFFTTKAPGEGTGLGLATSHGIITEHGGHIWAESQLGLGSTFFVELPIVSEEYVSTEESAAEKRDHGQSPADKEPTDDLIKTAHLLIIDDEVNLLNALQRALQRRGYQVDVVNNALAGLDRLAEQAPDHPYDIVLCDIRMPELSGSEFYKQVSSRFGEMARRIIFITGDSVSMSTRKFLEKSRAPYLAKPFELDDLLTRIETVLNTI